MKIAADGEKRIKAVVKIAADEAKARESSMSAVDKGVALRSIKKKPSRSSVAIVFLPSHESRRLKRNLHSAMRRN